MSRTRRTRVSNAPSRRTLSLIGLVAVGVGALSMWIGFNAPNNIPGRGYYNVQAEFRDADNLTAHYHVRVGGKLVGQVLNPRVEDGRAVVDLQLDPAVRPLRSDTRAVVRPRSAIGVRYLDLIPGQRGAPMAEGDRIPAEQTAATVALDDALGTLDSPRRRRAQELLTALGGGVAGRGEDLSAGLAQTHRFLGRTGQVLEDVNARTGALARLVVASRDAAVAADPVRDELAALPDAAADALSPFVDRSKAVEQTLTAAPATLRAVRDELGRTRALLSDVGRLTGRLRPALRAAPATLGETERLLRTAGPGVRNLRGTLVRLRDAVPGTVTALRDIRRALPAIDSAVAGLTPLVVELGPRECDIKRMVFNWQDMLAWGIPIDDDVLGGWLNTLRLTVIGTAESVGGAGPALKDLALTKRDMYPQPCVAAKKEGR